jgi:hypothetical protein
LRESTLVRFADDFVILVKGTREQAEALKEEAADVLRKDLRMELSLEKTRITHVTEGFDFLGHHTVLKPNHKGQMGVRVYLSKASGEPDASKVHVRFGEGLRETCDGKPPQGARNLLYYWRTGHRWSGDTGRSGGT